MSQKYAYKRQNRGEIPLKAMIWPCGDSWNVRGLTDIPGPGTCLAISSDDMIFYPLLTKTTYNDNHCLISIAPDASNDVKIMDLTRVNP